MNIFILDRNITKCAQYHCDQHVSKMILESVQIMCTCLYKKGFSTPYKPTHNNHPCVLWVEESYSNFIWLQELAIKLNEEFCYRYERKQPHASIKVLNSISTYTYQDIGLTEFAQAMPEKYKYPSNAVRAYRNFYRHEKINFATWKKRNAPFWLQKNGA